jgi:predicted Zn-dependent protease
MGSSATVKTFAEEMRVASPEVLALAAIARQYAEHGRGEEALKLLAGLLVLEPANAYLHTAIGCVLLGRGEDAEALVHFDEALRLDPREVAAQTYAGELRVRRGERAKALAHLDAAIALDPEGRDRHANRARTLRLAVEPGGTATGARG